MELNKKRIIVPIQEFVNQKGWGGWLLDTLIVKPLFSSFSGSNSEGTFDSTVSSTPKGKFVVVEAVQNLANNLLKQHDGQIVLLDRVLKDISR
jgi:hypothetical protein